MARHRSRKQEVAMILNYDRRHGIRHEKGSTLEKKIENYYVTKRGFSREHAREAAGATVGKQFRKKLNKVVREERG